MDDHSIRLIEKRDHQTVLSVVELNEEDEGELARRFLQRYFNQEGDAAPPGDIFVLEIKDEVVGVGGYRPCAPGGNKDYWLSLLYIHPYYHGNKLGTALLRYLVEMLRYRTGENLYVGVDTEDPNDHAVRFYEINGFREVPRPDVLPEEESEHTRFYHLSLNQPADAT